MFAVIRTGGKQYRVAKDDVITVEKLPGEADDTVVFDDVLMVGDKVGTPEVFGASVQAKVLRQVLGDKETIFKKKRRKNYRRTRGHRQSLTLVQITDILPKEKTSPAKTTSSKTATKTTKPEAAAKTTAKKKGLAKSTAKKSAKKTSVPKE